MTQTKIYPATKEQANTIINKIDAIDAKIVTPNYQDKTVTPSDVQQIVQADNGYNALHSVTVEPIAAAMPQGLEEFIMNTAQEPYSLSLDGVVPDCACYGKTYLKRVYGNLTSIGSYTFQNCSSLESIDAPNLTSIGSYTFQSCSSLVRIDLRKMVSFLGYANRTFSKCTALKYVDLRSLSILNNHIDYLFEFDSALELIDLSYALNAIPLGNTNIFQNTNNDWIAVVANDTVKAAFQSATNWSTYASHFRTIAEVEAEVGMTYDEYYLQCFGHPRF